MAKQLLKRLVALTPGLRVVDFRLFHRHGVGLPSQNVFRSLSQRIGDFGISLAAQRQRRQLTAPGLEPAVTSPFHPLKAPKTSSFSRTGTLK